MLGNRTHTCGELTEKSVNKKVILKGWISKVRDLGSVVFADLRDRYGKTQLVFNADINLDSFNSSKKSIKELSNPVLYFSQACIEYGLL